MKGFCFLIALLLVTIMKAAGQTVAPPADLAVTAELVHIVKPAEQMKDKSQFIPYLRLSIRNQANHPRDVVMMSCGWDDSWVQKGAYDLCGGWGCDKNFPKTHHPGWPSTHILCGAVWWHGQQRPANFFLGIS